MREKLRSVETVSMSYKYHESPLSDRMSGTEYCWIQSDDNKTQTTTTESRGVDNG